MWLIYLTGAVELATAIGALVPQFRKSAALKDLPIRGLPSTLLWSRTGVQLAFVALLAWFWLTKSRLMGIEPQDLPPYTSAVMRR